jgi:molybdenum cofactor biosynthesis enzyme MoaA
MEFKSFTHTSDGVKRGYIESGTLKELWFHTGTTCNLSCSFCLEGSFPGNDRLSEPTLAELKPYIDEAVSLGVENLSFTGGEPFVNKDFVNILEYASNLKPCLVLTNATKPLENYYEKILAIANGKENISFRVSIDHHTAEKHDVERGKGNFAKALKNMKKLQEQGFNVSLARQSEKNEDKEVVNGLFQKVFNDYEIKADTRIISFPDFAPPSTQVDVPEITEDCMTRYQNEETRAKFMCHYSRMIVKNGDSLKIFACTLVDDDDRYATMGTLAESMNTKTLLGHHRCFACFSGGASCSEM